MLESVVGGCVGLVALSGVLACGSLTACSQSAGEFSLLQSQDLVANGAPFDASEIVAASPMQDQQGLLLSDVQQFLQRPPYGPPSFLADYASNGLSAAEAIVVASQKYAINPLLFLVRAQMDEGLIGSNSYPLPGDRVEFAFGCGCMAPGQCDETFAGFDVQVDCLGAALRDSLDQVAATGATDGGWGPRKTSTTRDKVPVTPLDDSTAALYQYTPVVAQGHPGGNWLLWNLWQNYATALGYVAPVATTPAAWIGDACASDASCNYGSTQGTCATQYMGGLCTLACMQSCPSAPNEPVAVCAPVGTQGNLCLAPCNPADPQCRAGYTCKTVTPAGGTGAPANACVPN
jgi:hypothetical protein